MVRATCSFPLYLAPLLLAIASAGCVHTPPGEPVIYKLARKGEVVRLPQTVTPMAAAPKVAGTRAPEPSLPKPAEDDTVKVADAYSRGVLCVGMGNHEEAIRAFQEAVRLDPKFAGAWQYLASLYEQDGNTEKAKDAFKKAKSLSQ